MASLTSKEVQQEGPPPERTGFREKVGQKKVMSQLRVSSEGNPRASKLCLCIHSKKKQPTKDSSKKKKKRSQEVSLRTKEGIASILELEQSEAASQKYELTK